MNGVRWLSPAHIRSPMWIYFLRWTLSGTPNENFAFENRCKLCLCTAHYFLRVFSEKKVTYSLVIENV